MKRILLFIILLPNILLYGQNDPMPLDSALRWNGRSITFCGQNCAFMSYLSVYVDTVAQDTLIGSNYYKKLKYNGVYPDDYICSYRSDTVEKAIYLVPADSTNEHLFFDFDEGYVIGDTVNTIIVWPYVSVFEAKISEIDSIVIEGLYYKQYTLYELPFAYFDLTITERMLNSISFPFMPNYEFETNWELKCYLENDSSKFGSWCPFSAAEYATTVGLIEEVESEIKLFPNPSTHIVQIQTEYLNQSVIRIYDQIGRLMMTSRFIQSTSLNIEELESGIYSYSIENNGTLRTGKLVKN